MPCSRYCRQLPKCTNHTLSVMESRGKVLNFCHLTRGENPDWCNPPNTYLLTVWYSAGLFGCLLGWWCIRRSKMWQGWQRCSRGWQRWPHVAAVRLSDPSQGWSSGCQRQHRSTSARLFSTHTKEDNATRDGSDTGNGCRYARYFSLFLLL